MIRRILGWLQLPADKLSHYFHGQMSTLLLVWFIHPIFILLYILLISIAKEIWDYYNNGHVELLDILATLLGSAVIIGVSQWL